MDMERIWIYQADRKLNMKEAEILLKRMDQFTEQWTAHGKQLAAQALLKYNQFLIIRINEALAKATGCSIDKSTNTLKEVQQDLGVDFFDRMQIAYREGDAINTVSRKEFEALIANGTVDENTIVFNNMVNNSLELENNWEVPVKSSWHATIFQL